MNKWQVDVVAKVIYDQNFMRWQTYETDKGTVMVTWENLDEQSHARRQAIRDAEKLIRTVEQALPTV